VPRIAEQEGYRRSSAGSAGFWLFEPNRAQNWIFGAARVFRGIRIQDSLVLRPVQLVLLLVGSETRTGGKWG